ncbi:MAG: D-ribulokinase [Pseudonocardiales bacterium]|nr:D-ribulokinase [Pseudonocardiales bacterium]
MTSTTERVWVGLDLGTQSARALAVADDGTPLAAAARPLTSHRNGVRHEQDPARWWSALAEALSKVTGRLTDPTAIAGVALCATSGTVLLTDPDGTPRTPGLMYDDTRAGDLAQEAQDAGAELWERLAYRMQPAWALPKLLWWRDEGLLGDGARLAHQADLITARLVGRPVPADSSHALKTGYDLLDERWPDDVLGRLRVDPAVLPPVVRAGSVLGEVGAAAAEETGLPVGTPVVAGMTDSCAAQLGAGALSPGEWNTVLGTTLALKGVSATLLHDPTGALYSHRAPYGDYWLPGGASGTGAGVLTAVLPGADLPALTEAASRIGARPGDVPLCYPLAVEGERFPFVAPQARAFLVGPDGDGPLERGRVDDPTLFAAICHGTAHLERLCFDLLHHSGADVGGPVSLTGGGARNPWWNQLRCDVLGVPVRVPADAEGALGMAVLAAGAIGGDVPGAAARLVRLDRTLDPDPERGAALADAHVAFVDTLEQRGWLDPQLAEHARTRISTPDPR